MLPTAIQATFAPESWFEEFPLGRCWGAAEGGVYDEHLVRDVGVLVLAFIVVTAWSVRRAVDRSATLLDLGLAVRPAAARDVRRERSGLDVDTHEAPWSTSAAGAW